MCEQVYRIYRSPWHEEQPNSTKMQKFRKEASWHITNPDGTARSPVKFMGIIDTVGSLGVPNISAGIGLDYPGFYDQNISTEIEKVYHACSIHDRFWAFEPCRVRRAPPGEGAAPRPELGLREKWFPGCHYDVGRQQFKFLRQPQNVIERVAFRLPSFLTQPVVPNTICADLVLLWMLEAIQKEDIESTVIPKIESHISLIQLDLQTSTLNIGSGDVYSTIYEFTPACIFGKGVHYIGLALTKITDLLTPGLSLGTQISESSGLLSILQYVMATRDRRIPNEDAEVVDLNGESKVLGERSVEEVAGLNRYLSKTYPIWLEYLDVIGVRRP